MRRKEFLRRASAISVAALLTMNLCACQKEEAVISEEEKASNYQVTEENENKELVMNRQPESSYWFPGGVAGMESGRRSGFDLQYQ